MTNQWKEVDVSAPYFEGYAAAGLLIVHAYDLEMGGHVPNQFEVWHRASGEFMLDRVQEIACDLAEVADWASLSTTDEKMLHARLSAFAMTYPREVSADIYDWVPDRELDHIVPYGSIGPPTRPLDEYGSDGHGADDAARAVLSDRHWRNDGRRLSHSEG